MRISLGSWKPADDQLSSLGQAARLATSPSASVRAAHILGLLGRCGAWPHDVVGDTDQVTLGLDTSSALRSLPRYQELVRAIFLAPDSVQEMPCVEWKREGDAKDKRWRAELAKQVLGFANRDPEVASTWFGGCAYVLVGVAPGVLNGSPVHDAAQIESWLAPYVGRVPNGPEWNGGYVEVDGKAVLVLSVEPPQVGQPAWPCRKEYLADPKAPGYDPTIVLRDGAIYVRHKASTEEANSADIEMLNRRAAGSRRRIGGVSLLLGGESKAAALDASPESIEAWAEREREALKPPPPSPPAPMTQTVRLSDLDPTSSIARTAKMLAELSESAMSKSFATGLFEADTRTPEDYQKEVDAYIGKAEKRLPAVVLWRAYERGLGRLALFVRNDTDDPIRQLQVEIYIAGEGFAAFDEGDIKSASMPDRPVMLGKKVRSRFADMSAINLAGLGLNRYDHYLPNIGPIGRGVRIDNSGSVRLTFDALDLYPQETADLTEVRLFTNPTLAGKTLAAEWSARSRDASGVMRGRLDIEVDATVPSLDELLAEIEKPADEGEDDED
jgi:hypothetical protein